MSKKEKCKELMLNFFGPASASTVDNMTEEECVAKCKTKVEALLGPGIARKFDEIEVKT